MTTIQFTYRHIVDAVSEEVFDKNVFNHSYEEFLLKSQAYNQEGKFKSFTELKTNDGRANSLHYKCGFAASGFIEQLNKKMQGLTDNIGKLVSFTTYSFEVIESNIVDRPAHKVAIHFISPELLLHDKIGPYLVLSEKNNPSETFTLELRESVSITHYKQEDIS